MCCVLLVWLMFSVISTNYGFYIREPVRGSNSMRTVSPAMTYDDFLRWTAIYSRNLRKLGLYPVVTAEDERRSVELFNQNFAEFLRNNGDDASLESAEVISFENLENGVNNYVTVNTQLSANYLDSPNKNIETGPSYAVSNADAGRVFDIRSDVVGTDPSNFFIVVKSGENSEISKSAQENKIDGSETFSKDNVDISIDSNDDYIEENLEDTPTFVEAISSLNWELKPETGSNTNDSTEDSDVFDEIWERDEQHEHEMAMVMNVLGVDGQSLIKEASKIMGDEDEQFSEDLDDLIAMESSQEENSISFRAIEKASNSEHSNEQILAQSLETRIENQDSPDTKISTDKFEKNLDFGIIPPRILEIVDDKARDISNQSATDSASSLSSSESRPESSPNFSIEHSAVEPNTTRSEVQQTNLATKNTIVREVSTNIAKNVESFGSSAQILESEISNDMESILISPDELLNYFVDSPKTLDTAKSRQDSLNLDVVHLEKTLNHQLGQRENADKDQRAPDSVRISPDELFEIMGSSFEIDSDNLLFESNSIPPVIFKESSENTFEKQASKFEETARNASLNNDNEDRPAKNDSPVSKMSAYGSNESSDEISPKQMENSLEQEPSNIVDPVNGSHAKEDNSKKQEPLAPGSFTTLVSPQEKIPSIDSGLLESASTVSSKDKLPVKNVQTDLDKPLKPTQLKNVSSEILTSSNQAIKDFIKNANVSTDQSVMKPTDDSTNPTQITVENQLEPLNVLANRGHYEAELEVVEGVLQLYNDPLKESSSRKRILEPLTPENLQSIFSERTTLENEIKTENASNDPQTGNSFSVNITSMKMDPVETPKDVTIEEIIQEEPPVSSEQKYLNDDSWESGSLVPIIFPDMDITEEDIADKVSKEVQSLEITGVNKIENTSKVIDTNSDASSENANVAENKNLKGINSYEVLSTPKDNTSFKQIAQSNTEKDNREFIPVQIGEFIGKSYSNHGITKDATGELKPISAKTKQPNYNVYMPFQLLNENERAYDIFKANTKDVDENDNSEEITKIHQYNGRSDIPIQDYSDYYDYRDDYQQ